MEHSCCCAKDMNPRTCGNCNLSFGAGQRNLLHNFTARVRFNLNKKKAVKDCDVAHRGYGYFVSQG